MHTYIHTYISAGKGKQLTFLTEGISFQTKKKQFNIHPAFHTSFSMEPHGFSNVVRLLVLFYKTLGHKIIVDYIDNTSWLINSVPVCQCVYVCVCVCVYVCVFVSAYVRPCIQIYNQTIIQSRNQNSCTIWYPFNVCTYSAVSLFLVARTSLFYQVYQVSGFESRLPNSLQRVIYKVSFSFYLTSVKYVFQLCKMT